MTDGIGCPNCRHHLQVILETRRGADVVHRIRRCAKCDARFRTVEQFERYTYPRGAARTMTTEQKQQYRRKRVVDQDD